MIRFKPSGRYKAVPSQESRGCFDVVDTSTGLILITVLNKAAAKQRIETFDNADIRRANAAAAEKAGAQ